MIASFQASKEVTVQGIAADYGDLWGDSILAEYDRVLKERYGMFGFSGNEYSVAQKLDYYAKATFDEKRYIKYGGATCELDGYSLSDPNNFLTQINEILVYQTKPNIDILGEPDARNLVKSNEKGAEKRYIANDGIIDGLPSKLKRLELNKDLLSKISLTDYLFVFYKDYVEDRDLGKTFFNNEIEYVISGQLDDEKARKVVKAELMAERNASNLVYILTDADKMRALSEIAKATGPEAQAAVLVALTELWALIEADNDIKLLYDGKKVPIKKDDDTWATSLENLLQNIGKSEKDFESEEILEELEELEKEGNLEDKVSELKYVEPKVIKGLTYDQYLISLVSLMKQETVIYRMMDLIQINMKYAYLDGFLLGDYSVGLDYALRVNGEVHDFTKAY